jgi:hypothetical protein
MRFLFGLSLLVLFAFGQVPLEPCGVCSTIVQDLAGWEGGLEEKISSMGSTVCSGFSEELVTYEKCTSFVSLFAPYVVDLLLSEKPEEICSILGACDSESPSYKILFPQVEEKKVIYSITEKDIEADSDFRYKIFLGKFPFLNNSTYSLGVRVNKIAESDISIKVTNKKDYVETNVCSNNGECHIDISKPGMGVWYYITVNAKSQSQQNSTFTLEIKEENIASDQWIYQGGYQSGTFAVQMVVIFLALGVLCMVITKCIFGRRLGYLEKKIQLEEAGLLLEQNEFNSSGMLVFISQEGMQIPYALPQYVPVAPPDPSVQ